MLNTQEVRHSIEDMQTNLEELRVSLWLRYLKIKIDNLWKKDK